MPIEESIQQKKKREYIPLRKDKMDFWSCSSIHLSTSDKSSDQDPLQEMVGQDPKTVVAKLLANTSEPQVVNKFVAKDATYVSLSYSDPLLTKIRPWAGGLTHMEAQRPLSRHSLTWPNLGKTRHLRFELFWEGDNVAVFGSFTSAARWWGNSSFPDLLSGAL